MTNPQLLQPQHSQSIRSSALKSNKNVCTADKLGFVLDTSTHTLELSESFTELLTEAAKHPIRTQNDLLEAAASELDRNLLDHALTAHDSPFEYVRYGSLFVIGRPSVQGGGIILVGFPAGGKVMAHFLNQPFQPVRVFCL